MLRRVLLLTFVLFGSVTLPDSATQAESVFPFDQPEPTIQTSPVTDLTVALPGVVAATSLAVSPVTSEVAFLAKLSGGRSELRVWTMQSGAFRTLAQVPSGAAEIVWHPTDANTLFVSTGTGLFALDAHGQGKLRTIRTGKLPIAGLAAGPRPFLVADDRPVYRLFFGERQPNGVQWLRSIGENGAGEFVVARPNPPASDPNEPAQLPTVDAVLGSVAAFHPSGNEMLARDAHGCPVRLDYSMDGWGLVSAPANGDHLDFSGVGCDEHLQFSPNGLYLLRWKAGMAGVTVRGRNLGPDQTQRSDLKFAAQPLVTADGRGIVGVTADAGALQLHYAQIALELPDVADAWMFVRDADDLAHFTRHGGMLRPTALHQLYELYDTKLYYCGAYNFRTATRPYMVTTDAFWELYASAYEGLFVVIERTTAIPAFRNMITQGASELGKRAPASRLAKAFAAAQATLDGNRANPEAARILDAKDTALSDALGIELDYRVYAPRGHYADEEVLRRYFAAVRFIGHATFAPDEIAILRSLPPSVTDAARQWQTAYTAFIAAPRGPDAFSASLSSTAMTTLFPLSFGADNAVLERTVEHTEASGAAGTFALPLDGRTLPSGLDLAAAFGSDAAWRAMDDDGVFSRFPSLPGRLRALRRQFHDGGEGDGIYARWMHGLAVQWADSMATPISGPLWDAKRLQTGLASWATLRHATVLVNEVEGAECGGPGAEPIVMRPPRGQVEPDPNTFTAIAALFGKTEELVKTLYPPADKLGQGILRRLQQSRADTLRFADMARRQQSGAGLTAQDYADINFVGQAIEHNFKVFLSLMRKDEALVQPDPVDKVAEVAGNSVTGWLEAAVGGVLEWDQVAPAFGRHDIFKGAAYWYHEFTAQAPMNDAAWRAMNPRPDRPPWLARFVGRSAPEQSEEPSPP